MLNYEMDKEQLRDCVNRKLSLSQISKELGSSQTNIRYWLKKHGLSLARGPKGKLSKDFSLRRKCACGETDPSKFYGNKVSTCGKCHNKDVYDRGKKKRLEFISKFGSKCHRCGYSEFPCSLHFHHLNKNEKDPNFQQSRGWAVERLDEELKKCVLLCANCHAAVHAGFIEGYLI